MSITKQQEDFMWLAHIEGKTFDEIAKELQVDRKEISRWEVDLKDHWSKLAEIKKLYNSKKIKDFIDIRVFIDWYNKTEKRCHYCGITEEDLSILNKKEITKRSRGKKLELDRKKPDLSYEELDNIVFACYWCNNAKTDTFTYEEFQEIGKVISKIWKKRLEK